MLERVPDPSKDIGLLLHKALEKIAFLPFGLMIDQYRWKVFSGEIPPDKYNQAWWQLRLKYQGIAPPVDRTEADFDPAAKYHVAANVPYARYFLADILQFQFHRALSKIAGCTDPLNRCSIYDNKEAGRRLNAMLAMGRKQALAGRIGDFNRATADGCYSDTRLLRAIEKMAGRTESRKAGRLVALRSCCLNLNAPRCASEVAGGFGTRRIADLDVIDHLGWHRRFWPFEWPRLCVESRWCCLPRSPRPLSHAA